MNESLCDFLPQRYAQGRAKVCCALPPCRPAAVAPRLWFFRFNTFRPPARRSLVSSLLSHQGVWSHPFFPSTHSCCPVAKIAGTNTTHTAVAVSTAPRSG